MAAALGLREALPGAQRQVEERLRVLERSATDRGGDLASEIEGLRERTPKLENAE